VAQLAVLLQFFSNWLLVQSALQAIDIAKPKSDIATLSDAWVMLIHCLRLGCHQLADRELMKIACNELKHVETVVSLP